jgi:hypothetical protein
MAFDLRTVNSLLKADNAASSEATQLWDLYHFPTAKIHVSLSRGHVPHAMHGAGEG